MNIITEALNSILIIGLTVTIMTDLTKNRIKMTVTIPLLVLGLVSQAFRHHSLDSLLAILLGFGILAIVRVLGQAIFKRESLGKGDLLLNAVLGAWTSPALILWGTYYAFILGGLTGAILLLTKTKSKTDTLPFGPLLIAGSGLAWILQ